MIDSDDFFQKIPLILIENRSNHLDLNNLVLDSINDLADLIKNEMISDEVIELLKNCHSIRRKIFLVSYLINSNEYQGSVSVLRSLIESVETLLIFMIYPNQMHQSLGLIIDGGFKKFEESQKNLRKLLREKYIDNDTIIQKFNKLEFFKNEMSSSGAHSNYIINRSFSHQDFYKEGSDIHIMSDNGMYDNEHYLILNLYLLKIVYLCFDIILSIGEDSIFSSLIKYSSGKQKQLNMVKSIKQLQGSYHQSKYPELFDL